MKTKLPQVLNFTHHAFIRARERMTLDTNQISQIIKWEKFVSIGTEKDSNREHRLFYSRPDSQCFVLIQDIKTQTIITILPLDYHESISWAVSLELQKEAKELILGKAVIPYSPTVNQEDEITNHKFYIISCDVLDGYCELVKKIKLGKFDACDFNYDLNNLLNSDVFLDDILNKINIITNGTDYHVKELMIKKKSKDIAPSFIQFEELISFETLNACTA